MSPADRNKVFIAGGIALIAIVVIVFVVLRGRRAGTQELGAGAGAFGPPLAEAPAGAPGFPPAPGEQAPGAPAPEAEVEVAAGPAARVGVIRMGRGSDEPTRPDPFQTFQPPVRPPAPELVVSLPTVTLEPGGLRPGGPSETFATIGRRRVAGVMFNERPWAILEEEDKTFIVKPGDVVAGIRITAIARDSIFLLDPEGRRWRVPLRGLGLGVERASAAASRTAGMPELPPVAF